MEEDQNTIKIGDYIVIQKQKYFRLHQLNAKCDVTLGKDRVDLKIIVGQKFWTTFKLIPKTKREYSLEVATTVKSLPDTLKEVASGNDNRNITDDGKSQLLSTEEIVAFRDSGLSAQNIVGKLIESSTTFKSKTEYSQEKYLKKKEKKYFEYIVIRKPTMRLIADIFYAKDQFGVFGLRHDSIAQILSYANIQSTGTYLLFETGTQALLGAAILDNLEGGNLVNITAGKLPPKQAILGMNFSEEKLKRLMSVKLTDFIASLEGKKGENGHVSEGVAKVGGKEVNLDKVNVKVESDGAKKSNEGVAKVGGNEVNLDKVESNEAENDAEPDVNGCETLQEEMMNGSPKESDPGQLSAESTSRKRKLDQDGDMVAKKPRWVETLEKAVDIAKSKTDGLIVACKDYPLNTILKLLDYLKPSRRLVVYSVYREPLVQLYSELKKQRKDLVGLHLYENWLRNYQVLTDRTHPDVSMSASGGHILVGTKVTFSR